jgi:alanine racemase
MNRAGLDRTAAAALLAQLSGLPGVRLAGVYSHFATAGEDPRFVAEQARRFDRELLALGLDEASAPGVCRHIANSAASALHPRQHRDLVRVGLGLHGYGPAVERPTALSLKLRPVLSWYARLAQVQPAAAGQTVGYQRTHRLDRPSRLGLVPVGYADGYPLSLSGRSCVRLLPPSPERQVIDAPVLGLVNMDQLVIDVTDCPWAREGLTVELIGSDPSAPNSLPRLAQLAQASCYELMCRMSPKLPRVHVSESIGSTMSG